MNLHRKLEGKPQREYDAWKHYCSAIFPDGKGVFVMVNPINVYCDASCNQPRDTSVPIVYAISAQAATVDNWERTRKEWRRELDARGVDHFHMTEFMYAKRCKEHGNPIKNGESNPFVDLPLEDFDPLFEKLVRVMTRKTRKGIKRIYANASSILREEFLRLRPSALERDVRCANPYVFNAYVLLWNMRIWADQNKYDGKFYYLFSHGDEGQEKISKLFEYIIDNDEMRNGFRLHYMLPQTYKRLKGMTDEPAIQIADVVAGLDQEGKVGWHQTDTPDFIDPTTRSHYLNLYTKHGGEIRGHAYRQEELEKEFAQMLKNPWFI